MSERFAVLAPHAPIGLPIQSFWKHKGMLHAAAFTSKSFRMGSASHFLHADISLCGTARRKTGVNWAVNRCEPQQPVAISIIAETGKGANGVIEVVTNYTTS